jgi:hypothetical protein
VPLYGTDEKSLVNLELLDSHSPGSVTRARYRVRPSVRGLVGQASEYEATTVCCTSQQPPHAAGGSCLVFGCSVPSGQVAGLVTCAR